MAFAHVKLARDWSLIDLEMEWNLVVPDVVTTSEFTGIVPKQVFELPLVVTEHQCPEKPFA